VPPLHVVIDSVAAASQISHRFSIYLIGLGWGKRRQLQRGELIRISARGIQD